MCRRHLHATRHPASTTRRPRQRRTARPAPESTPGLASACARRRDPGARGPGALPLPVRLRVQGEVTTSVGCPHCGTEPGLVAATSSSPARRLARAGRANELPQAWKVASYDGHRSRAVASTARHYSCSMRFRASWAVILAAALLVGLLAYGVASKRTDTSLDDATADGQAGRGAGTARLPLLGATASLARRLQGQGRRPELLGLLVPAVHRGAAAARAARRRRSPAQNGMVLGRQLPGRLRQRARLRAPLRAHLPEPARQGRRVRRPATARAPSRRRSWSTARAGSPRSGAVRSTRRGWTRRCRRC